MRTPPLSCGLLPGVLRAELGCPEEVLRAEDLPKTRLWVGNALRGLIPAVVDAVADRLRPVLLTTLTTVLGLAPLLFERSSQAEFLKPTVITLSYGLGFGMVLVLLVVPAIIVVQEDLGRSGRALRRARQCGCGAGRGPAAG